MHMSYIFANVLYGTLAILDTASQEISTISTMAAQRCLRRQGTSRLFSRSKIGTHKCDTMEAVGPLQDAGVYCQHYRYHS